MKINAMLRAALSAIVAACATPLVSVLCAAQTQRPSSSDEAQLIDTPSAIFAETDPLPHDAQKAILALFDKYEVVGIGAGHGNKDLDDFILALVRHPAFPGKVNEIAVECGNSLYQPILDRYIAGEAVPLDVVQSTWRNTSQPMCALSSFYEQLFPLIRQINLRLPKETRLRVLAGDPPADWSKPSERSGDRDGHIASVMEQQVLSKKRKALMLFGTAHLFHGDPRSAVGLYERDYPGVTYIISEHHGFGLGSPLAKDNDALERRLASWPAPALANIKGTWLGNLDFGYIMPDERPAGQRLTFSQMADGFLYFGPRDLLLYEHMPLNVALDKDYMAALQGRFGSALEHELDLERMNPSLYQTALGALFSRPGVTSDGVKGKRPVAGDIKWVGSFTNSRGDKRSLTLNLKVDGEKLTGTVTGGPPTGEEEPIRNGKIAGNRLSWELIVATHGKDASSPPSNGSTLLFRYQANVSGNQIAGTITGPQGEVAPFSVTKP